MAMINGQILIERPIDEVFDYVADERNEPRYNARVRSVEKVSSGPIGVGTRYRAAITTLGRPATMTIEITAYERPTRLASSTAAAAIDINGHLSFEAVPTGTVMRWEWDVDTAHWSKVLAPVIARLGRRQERRVWTNLKRVLEGDARPISVSPSG